MRSMMNPFPVVPGHRVSFLRGGLGVGEGFLPASCRFIPFLYFHPLAS